MVANFHLDPSDDSPTRYATFDVTREPTIPVVGAGSPERPFNNFSQLNTPQKSVTFENYSPPGGHSPTDTTSNNQFPPQGPYQPRPSPPRTYQAYQEHPPSLVPMGMMARSPPRNHPPELFERRRPPVPPSMRRNRSPPQNGEYDLTEMDTPSGSPPRGGPIPRSASVTDLTGGAIPTRPPPVFGPSDRQRRQRRSNSLSGIDNGRFLIPAGDPMHPTIVEVPSVPTTPATESPPTMNNGTAAPRSNSMTGTRPNMWSAEAESARGQLAVRNPEPMSPGPGMTTLNTTGMGEQKEGNLKQLGNIVRRMSNKDGHHKVEDAAKNF